MMNKPCNVQIELLCEGKTEEHYFNGLIEELRSETGTKAKIRIRSLEKRAYKNVSVLLEREPYNSKVMVILDLDRACNNKQELKHLKKLISIIKDDRKNKFLFLTFSDFEDWLRHHFNDSAKNSKDNLYRKFDKVSSSEFKSDIKDIYKRVKQKQGDIKNAECYFEGQPLFCNKDLQINESNVCKIQSNLYAFREVFKKLVSANQ